MTTEPLLDCRGLRCPLPVLKLEKRMDSVPAGSTLAVLATDPVARVDIPLYCRQRGHDCAVTEAEGVLRFEIRKSG